MERSASRLRLRRGEDAAADVDMVEENVINQLTMVGK